MSDKNLELAANAYIQQMQANRNQLFSRMGNFPAQSVDTKHPDCWHDYGYPTQPDFGTFYTLYDRTSLGFAGVEATVDKCWQTNPWIRETDDKKAKPTAFEAAFDQWAENLDLWPNMRTLDQRQRVGRYGAFLVTVADDKSPSEPITGTLNPDQIVKIVPLYESQLKVLTTYKDNKKANYGLPETYQYNEGALGDENPDTNASYTVHESRVIIWAEGASGNSIYGRSCLRAGMHNLINLEKIGGAGGEGLRKAACPPYDVSIQDGADVQSLAQIYDCEPKELAAKIGEKLVALNRGLDSAFVTKGMDVSTLVHNMPNPKDWVDDQKQQFAASVKTPLTILLGNQSGNQASQENGSTFDETCESRRNNEIARFIKRDLFGWLKRFRVFEGLDKKKIYVCWDSLLEPSLGERMDIVLKIADANQKLMGSGEVFATGDEMRDVIGWEPLDVETMRDEDEGA